MKAYLLCNVRTAVLVMPPLAALIVTVVFALTGAVVMGNVADIAPAGTVAFAGTAALLGLLLLRVTPIPLAGAGPVKVTFPTALVPPLSIAGFKLTEASAAGLTDKFADFETAE